MICTQGVICKYSQIQANLFKYVCIYLVNKMKTPTYFCVV